MRQVAGAGQGVADDPAAGFHQPGRLGRIGEIGRGGVDRMGRGEEESEVAGRIEVAEGLGERGRTDRRQGCGVGWNGAADHGFAHWLGLE